MTEKEKEVLDKCAVSLKSGERNYFWLGLENTPKQGSPAKPYVAGEVISEMVNKGWLETVKFDCGLNPAVRLTDLGYKIKQEFDALKEAA